MAIAKIICGHVLDSLRDMGDESVDCCITSPPYWGLRDYGVPGQIGLEETPEEFIAIIVAVFQEVHRVLRDDGTLWLNIGDSYSHGGCGSRDSDRWPKQSSNNHMVKHRKKGSGLKPKNLMGMPWRVAFALQADGWYLRQDIIWHKPNPMPESVRDRCTKAHEYLFLLSKSEKYYYDAEAIQEPVTGGAHSRGDGVNPKAKVPAGWDTSKGGHREKLGRYPKPKQNESFSGAINELVEFRNKRSVWTIQPQAFAEAHFATFPEKLVEPCILAGTPAGAVVLDPFAGSGTTGLVALKLDRDFVGIELNPEYVDIARQRIGNDAPLFDQVEVDNGG